MSAKLLKVLFLEDSEYDAEIVAHKLIGIAAVKIVSSREAFESALKENFDVALVDLQLSDFSGQEAMGRIKSECPDLPVIIITGSVDGEEADLACEYGASRFFLKDDLHGLERAVRGAYETRLLKAQSIRDNRLEILGHMTAGFCHDLNNLLHAFMAGTELLRKPSKSEDASRVLDAMASSAKRGAEMSKQITTFLRGSNGIDMKSVSAEFLLGEIGSMLRNSFPKNIRVLPSTVRGTSQARCDPTQIHQLLLNLAINARDVMPDGGELHFVAQNVTLREGPLIGEFVMIMVRDTGPGIPDNVLPRIFEPFFTTKAPGKGTGLGLSMARVIARDHGGEIECKTGTAGTSFFVYLPVAVRETHAERVERAEEFDGEGRTILLVDDEAHMRMMVGMFLKDAGYKPLVAASGPEALSYFRSNENIALLLTDVGMAHMTGIQLAEILRSQSFQLPIVFLTGEADLLAPPEASAVLQKPFTRNELLAALKRALDA